MLLHSIVAPFVAGFIAVLVFHQGVWAIFSAAGKTPSPPWDMKPTGPFGVPSVVNASFWGGVWGLIIFWLVLPVSPLGYWATCILFGALLTSLVALLVVFPAKGMPFAAGWNPAIWVFALLVNGAWGFGFGLLLPLVQRLFG
jgi:hypothetical protein